MAREITFDTGLVDYEVNGVPVRFNPADETFAARLEGMIGSLDGLQGRLKGESFAEFGELDAEMRAAIDGLLGEGVADALFPNMNCYAVADGLPAWLNLASALTDEVAGAFEREFGKTDARLKAHSQKYDAMMRKYRKK